MVLKRQDGDLCKSYRPQTFSELIGQEKITESLRVGIRSKTHSQCYLFYGHPGCGKTTVARILAKALSCTNPEENGNPCCECMSCIGITTDSYPDFKEVNAADAGGKDDARRIRQDMRVSPMFGKTKFYIIDEAHRLTSQAQDNLLKGTEDMCKGVYIVFCSTEHKKIIKPLRDRCEQHYFNILKKEEILSLIESVGVMENYYPSKLILNTIVELSEGKPRNSLKLLQKAINLKDLSDDDVIISLNGELEDEAEIIDLCRLITSKKPTSWKEIVESYKKINVDKETIRTVAANWFKVILERPFTASDMEKAANTLEHFIEPLPPIKPDLKLTLILYKAYKIFRGN